MINKNDVGKLVIDSEGYTLKLKSWNDRSDDWTAALSIDDRVVLFVTSSELHCWTPVPTKNNNIFSTANWITNCVPTADDALEASTGEFLVFGIDTITGRKPILMNIHRIELGMPWLPIPEWRECCSCKYYERKNNKQVCWHKGVFNPKFSGTCRWEPKN